MAEPQPDWTPSVDVVIPTHDRPQLVREAIDSVRSQVYAGTVTIIVVFDRSTPDESLADTGPVPVRVIRNTRTPGLCGARNSGIIAGTGELVAFLDDDDTWLAHKLARQVRRLIADKSALMATTSIRVDYAAASTPRLTGTDVVTHEQLLASRMSMVHSSTFLLRRSALLSTPGLVDETAPDGQNEDWDLLLRYSAVAPIAHLDEPLVAVRWGSTSLFARAWRTKLDGARWALARHPDIATSRVGHARVLGQIAFAHAGVGERGAAVRVAMRAIRVRWREPRGYLALLTAAGVPPNAVLAVLHRWGRGV